MRLGRRNGGGRRSFGDLLSNQQIYRALSYRPASYTVPRCARLFIRLQMNKEGRSMLADQERRARANGYKSTYGFQSSGREVSGTARVPSLSLSPVMSYAKPLSRPGRNHDRSSRELPRGTASYTNSRPEHGV